MGDSQPNKIAAFWSELRRRRVVRAVVLYAIAGWVVIEVASTVSPNLNLPEWTVKLITIIVALGFIMVIMLAWAFDLERDPSPSRATAADENTTAAAPADGADETTASDSAPQAADDHRKSIAVMPFVNLSDDVKNEYFSDGISEEILNLMAKLPQLRVASRTSSFMFKGRQASIPTIAAELGVTTVLEGSVRRAGNRVRITAQLIDATSDSHLWSETYDRELEDVFAIQDDIAQCITDALKVTLSPKERRSIQSVATADVEAYDFYLRGRSCMHTMTRRDYESAIRMFRKAIELDEKYALAFAGLADAYSYLFRYVDGSRQNAEQARTASDQAISLDPDSAEARASRGLAMLINEEYAEAESEFRKAIELNPNLFEAYYYFGLALTSQGQFADAADRYRKAVAINPADYQSQVFLAQAYASLGRRHDEMKARLAAIEVIERHLKIFPHDARALYAYAATLCNVGRQSEGMRIVERALGQDDTEPVVLYNSACLYAMQGDSDRAMELLTAAVERGWGDRPWLETDSDLDSVRGDPRFAALLERIH